MSNRLFLIVNSRIRETGRAFLDWGRRQPFLFSAVLIIAHFGISKVAKRKGV
jgi:hypothetical protein